MTLFYFSSPFVCQVPNLTRKYVTHAGKFVGCEAAIAIDMMLGAMQEQ